MKSKKSALISVWDKTDIIKLANFLYNNNFEIISTGGTSKYIKESGIPVVDVSEITLQKEIMNGRVKTLHPNIFGGILFDRNNKNHFDDLIDLNSKPIDVVVTNLYPFKNINISNEISYAYEDILLYIIAIFISQIQK